MQSKNTVCITRYVQFLFRFKSPTLAFFGRGSAFRSGQLRGAASPKISVPKLIELSFCRWQVGGKIKATAWVIIYIFTQQLQKWVNMRGKCFTETFDVYNWTAELISACNWYDTITWKIASHTNHTHHNTGCSFWGSGSNYSVAGIPLEAKKGMLSIVQY